MNLRIITKNHAADPEIGFLTKSISKPYDRATTMPTALELINQLKHPPRVGSGLTFSVSIFTIVYDCLDE